MVINEETMKVPDYAETRLAFRTWRHDPRTGLLLSVNAGRSVRSSWMARAMSAPEGEWRPGQLMMGVCTTGRHEGPVPDSNCTCGVYATSDLSVVNDYLSDEAPVLGVVELGGRTIPATQGYRSQAARVAAILLIDEVLSLRHYTLERIAEHYCVPPLIPHSVQPEHYRAVIGSHRVDWDAELQQFFSDPGKT